MPVIERLISKSRPKDYRPVENLDKARAAANETAKRRNGETGRKAIRHFKRSSARSLPFRRFALSPVRNSHSSLTPA
jgi:hypothetical protein